MPWITSATSAEEPNWSLLHDSSRTEIADVDFQILVSDELFFLVREDRPVVITHFIKSP